MAVAKTRQELIHMIIWLYNPADHPGITNAVLEKRVHSKGYHDEEKFMKSRGVESKNRIKEAARTFGCECTRAWKQRFFPVYLPVD